jgi:hypothetical protein
MGYVEVTNMIYGKPLIILSECFFMSCEGMFLPLFALYENGQILYRKETINEKMNFFEVLLTNDEKNIFINSLPFSNIYNIKEKTIDASEGWTDQPMTILELNITSYKKVRIDGCKIKYIPKDYLLIYDELKKYNNKKAHKWYPDSICVKFNKAFSNENYKNWPDNLPEININAKKDDKDNIPLILEKKYLEEYFNFYNSLTRFQNIKYKNNLFSIHHEMEYPNIEYIQSMCDEE